MPVKKTPQWLVDTQNKSWEPEILISGITLTFLFILSDKIYNFNAMLVQDYAVMYSVAKTVYIISMIFLTGFKIVLITHLVLRGLWTGLVGLSYVFPRGVIRENLAAKEQKIEFRTPTELVIQVEKLCSMLFAFIFSTITFALGFFALYIPIILLFISGLDLTLIRDITVYAILPAAFLFGLLLTYLGARKEDSSYNKKIASLFFNNLLAIYFSNIGRKKMWSIFVLYFAVIAGLTFNDITSFNFRNNAEVDIPYKGNVPQLNNDNYENLRDKDLRIPRATIDRFRFKSRELDLFIGLYRGDFYTLKKIEENPHLLPESEADETRNITSIYTIYLDDEELDGLNFYRIEKQGVSQDGLMTTIPIGNLKPGLHKLKISKLYWKISKKRLKRINNWQVISFEVAPKNLL